MVVVVFVGGVGHFSMWAVDKMFFYFYFLWCFYYITFVFYLVLSWRNCV
jgi:hypothetical protein